eukprot:g17423.t1
MTAVSGVLMKKKKTVAGFNPGGLEGLLIVRGNETDASTAVPVCADTVATDWDGVTMYNLCPTVAAAVAQNDQTDCGMNDDWIWTRQTCDLTASR